MARERRRQMLLAALGVILLVVIVRAWSAKSGVPLASSKGAAGTAASGRRQAATAAPDVHLKTLDVERPTLMEGARNLFRFKPKAPPPPVSQPVVAPPPSAPLSAPTGPPPPPPLPQIALKFIGIVQTADKSQRLAVLSDGRGGFPMYGKEGDIIDGRYRIVKISNESIELSYLDGRGRQTIRLSGS